MAKWSSKIYKQCVWRRARFHFIDVRIVAYRFTVKSKVLKVSRRSQFI